MQLINFKYTTFLLAFVLIGLSSCVKDKFDAPDNGGCIDEKLERNITIQDLKGAYTGSAMQITEQFIIEGVVISSDNDGNFYKELVIQDETGGILLLIDQNNIHADFPMGRKVYVLLESMYMDDYGGLIQLGSSLDPETGNLQRIPQSLISDFIKKGACNQTVEPLKLSFNELNPETHQSMLVSLDYLRMDSRDAGKPYANPTGSSSQNRTILNCSNASGILRTSDFSGFSAENTPEALFSMTAVFSIFNSDKQFKIRDLRDIVETEESCPCEEIDGNISGTTSFQLDNVKVEDAQQNVLFFEDFQSVIEDADIALSGWKNLAENASIKWEGDGYQQERYGRISCYQTAATNVVSWLISPAINIAGAQEILSLETKDAFDDGAILEVLISTDYTGGNTPWSSATWEKICPELAGGTSSGFAPNWTLGTVDISAYTGTAYIAFRYKGSDE